MKSNDFNLPSQEDNTFTIPVQADLPATPRNHPTVVAKVRRTGDGIWELKIDCPHCSETHFHGGGNGDRPFGGFRVPHCQSSEFRRRGHKGEISTEQYEIIIPFGKA